MRISRVGSAHGAPDQRGREYLHYKGLKIDVVISTTIPPPIAIAAKRTRDDGAHQRHGSWWTNPAAFSAAHRSMPGRSHPAAPGGAGDRDRARRAETSSNVRKCLSLAGCFIPRLPSQYPSRPWRRRMTFFNGLGGFHQGGREYVTLLGAEQWTRRPGPTSSLQKRFWFSSD